MSNPKVRLSTGRQDSVGESLEIILSRDCERPGLSITFAGPFTGPPTLRLVVTNDHYKPVAVKTMLTTPKNFTFVPNSAIAAPLQSVPMIATFKGTAEEARTSDCKLFIRVRLANDTLDRTQGAGGKSYEPHTKS